MKETILIYNTLQKELLDLYNTFCEQQQIAFISVPKEEYAVPLGFLAYGSQEQKKPYIGGGGNLGFDEPMLIFAGFTNQRLTQILKELREKGMPIVSLKAVLTEHNALWDSVTLYGHLAEERAQFEQMKNSNQ